MLALSVQLHDGTKSFFMPPDDTSLKVDGSWVDPGMIGDGIPHAFDQLSELCSSLKVKDLKDFVLDEGLQWERQNSPGRGPDMEERLAAFSKKS